MAAKPGSKKMKVSFNPVKDINREYLNV